MEQLSLDSLAVPFRRADPPALVRPSMSPRPFLTGFAVCLFSCAVASCGQPQAAEGRDRPLVDADRGGATGLVLGKTDARTGLMASLEYFCERIGFLIG